MGQTTPNSQQLRLSVVASTPLTLLVLALRLEKLPG